VTVTPSEKEVQRLRRISQDNKFAFVPILLVVFAFLALVGFLVGFFAFRIYTPFRKCVAVYGFRVAIFAQKDAIFLCDRNVSSSYCARFGEYFYCSKHPSFVEHLPYFVSPGYRYPVLSPVHSLYGFVFLYFGYLGLSSRRGVGRR
jgi:hypothetical protein